MPAFAGMTALRQIFVGNDMSNTGHPFMYSIDTLKATKKLVKVGFTQEQAEAQAVRKSRN